MTKKLKNLIKEERPRERLIKYGAENISTEDLISIILKTGTKEMSVKDLSISVLSKIDNIGDLQNLTLSKLKNIKGIGTVKALELISAIELGRRVYHLKNQIVLEDLCNNHLKYNMPFLFPISYRQPLPKLSAPFHFYLHSSK